MSLALDASAKRKLEGLRVWGHDKMRPLGLEADRAGSPLPVDHPYFVECLERGGGRTSWKSAEATTSIVDWAFSAEEASYWDRGVLNAEPGPGLPHGTVLANATEEQKERFLGPFVDPDRPRWACYALTEPGGGSDTAAFRTKAIRDGQDWIITGAKCFIGAASRADWLLVQATLEPEKERGGKQRAFFVEQGTPGLGGFKIEKKMGLKAYESTSFVLDEVRVPAENLLGGEALENSKGRGQAMRSLNMARPIVASCSVGMARAAIDETLAFVRQHGLANDVRVRDRISYFSRKVRAAWLLTLKGAWLADQEKPNVFEASMAKAMAADVLMEVTFNAMDILGLVGAQGEHTVEKIFRDAKAMDIVEGTGQIQRLVMARKLVSLPR